MVEEADLLGLIGDGLWHLGDIFGRGIALEALLQIPVPGWVQTLDLRLDTRPVLTAEGIVPLHLPQQPVLGLRLVVLAEPLHNILDETRPATLGLAGNVGAGADREKQNPSQGPNQTSCQVHDDEPRRDKGMAAGRKTPVQPEVPAPHRSGQAGPRTGSPRGSAT